jgi:NDP-sugar pyrophosphorylase family protein
MGINAFSKSIIDLIPKDEFFGFDDLMHRMLEKGIEIRPHRFEGLWYDIGRPDDYDAMLQDFKANQQSYLPEGA